MIQSVASMAPQLSPSLGAALWPYSKQPFTIANAAGPYVFKDAQRKDAAKIWIQQFEYAPQHYLAHIATAPGLYLPQRQSVLQSPDYLNLPLIKANPDALNILNQSAQLGGNEARESPQHKINPAGGTIDTGTILADVVQKVIVNHETAQSAVTWGHQQLADVVKNALSS
jgi:hypothetical protein